MSGSSKIFGNSLLSGNYNGRVIEVSFEAEQSQRSSPEYLYSILVLVEDQLLPLSFREKKNINKGALISFGVTENSEIKIIKIKNHAFNFDTESDLLRWRRPANNPSRMEMLRTRQRILRAIREWFEEQNFIETETPILVRAPSPEAQFSPEQTSSGYLITSPEFQMKRLLSGGFERIFQFARCFRKNESGPLHNPEFTMLEWYRTNKPLEMLMSDIEQMVKYLTETVSAQSFPEQVPLPPWPRVTVSELFKKHLDIILDGSENADHLRKKAILAGFYESKADFNTASKLTEPLDYEQIFFKLWNYFEADLGIVSPVFVYRWPLPLASLARQCPEHPGFADRVELYADGMELANGFEELTDASEQRRRFEQDLENRKAEGRSEVPLDDNLIKSLEQGLPESSGMALGVDRLIMWLCGIQNIRDVICFSENEI